MKALVTGATGFIGSHLVEALLSRGYSVRCLVRASSNLRWLESLPGSGSADAPSLGSPSVELFRGDCEEIESLKEAVKGCEYVFHVAGVTKARQNDEFFSVNAGGTENLIHTILNNGVELKRFVLLSSLAAVGPSLNGTPVNEETEPRPVSFYGKSKLEAEMIVAKVKDRIPTTIIRPPAVYGPRDRDLYLFFKLIKSGFYPYWGRAYYSLIYIDDLINGIILSAESEGAVGKVFFISDMEVHTNEEIAAEIARIFEKQPARVRVPKGMMTLFGLVGERLFPGGIINRDKVRELRHACWVCDSTLVNRELGYNPSVRLREGVRWTADWYRINRWL